MSDTQTPDTRTDLGLALEQFRLSKEGDIQAAIGVLDKRIALSTQQHLTDHLLDHRLRLAEIASTKA